MSAIPDSPAAWFCLAKNGNVRIWFSDKESADRWAKENELFGELMPLYPSASMPPDSVILAFATEAYNRGGASLGFQDDEALNKFKELCANHVR